MRTPQLQILMTMVGYATSVFCVGCRLSTFSSYYIMLLFTVSQELYVCINYYCYSAEGILDTRHWCTNCGSSKRPLWALLCIIIILRLGAVLPVPLVLCAHDFINLLFSRDNVTCALSMKFKV